MRSTQILYCGELLEEKIFADQQEESILQNEKGYCTGECKMPKMLWRKLSWVAINCESFLPRKFPLYSKVCYTCTCVQLQGQDSVAKYSAASMIIVYSLGTPTSF